MCVPKNYQNTMRFDKVIAKIKGATVLPHSVVHCEIFPILTNVDVCRRQHNHCRTEFAVIRSSLPQTSTDCYEIRYAYGTGKPKIAVSQF